MRSRLTFAPARGENRAKRERGGCGTTLTPDRERAARRTIPDYYFDLHSHSTDATDDAGGTVEGYLKWIVAQRKKGYKVDGIVLTEHRQYDPLVRYDDIAEQYGVKVLKGVEVETTVGHVLVYGIDDRFTKEFDLRNVALPYEDVFRAAREFGGYAVGAHAGRPRIGLAEHVAERAVSLDYISAIEQLNGGSNDVENDRAQQLAEDHGLHRVGGSDAHFVSAIGRCLTAFARPIGSVEDLVHELISGEYHPVTIEQTRDDQPAPATPDSPQSS